MPGAATWSASCSARKPSASTAVNSRTRRGEGEGRPNATHATIGAASAPSPSGVSRTTGANHCSEIHPPEASPRPAASSGHASATSQHAAGIAMRPITPRTPSRAAKRRPATQPSPPSTKATSGRSTSPANRVSVGIERRYAREPDSAIPRSRSAPSSIAPVSTTLASHGKSTAPALASRDRDAIASPSPRDGGAGAPGSASDDPRSMTDLCPLSPGASRGSRRSRSRRARGWPRTGHRAAFPRSGSRPRVG